MSKSKRNTIDPSDIMESYGADTARWFMLSDSPPDRDVIWTEESVAGAYRFVQRVWRLIGEWSEEKAAAPAPAAGANEANPAALALRKSAHRALAASEDAIRGLRFNVAVARTYELVNAIAAATGSSQKDAMLRQAIDEALRPPRPHAGADDAPSCRGVLDRAGP